MSILVIKSADLERGKFLCMSADYDLRSFNSHPCTHIHLILARIFLLAREHKMHSKQKKMRLKRLLSFTHSHIRVICAYSHTLNGEIGSGCEFSLIRSIKKINTFSIISICVDNDVIKREFYEFREQFLMNYHYSHREV